MLSLFPAQPLDRRFNYIENAFYRGSRTQISQTTITNIFYLLFHGCYAIQIQNLNYFCTFTTIHYLNYDILLPHWPRSSVGIASEDLIRRSWVQTPARSHFLWLKTQGDLVYRKYCLLPVPKHHKNIYIIVTQPESLVNTRQGEINSTRTSRYKTVLFWYNFY